MSEAFARIAECYARDQANPRKAVAATDIPLNYDAITAEWLTAVLCKDSSDAHVVSFALDRPDDGTSNRRRIFLTYDEAGDRAGLPASVFCKATSSLSSRILLGVSGGLHAETTFYNQARHLIDLNAPRAYLAQYDPESFASIVVLNDLAAQVEFCNERTAVNLTRARSQIRLLARLHARFYESPDLATPRLDFETWPRFWKNLDGIGLGAASDRGFLAAEAVIPPRLFKRHAEIWPAALRSVDAQRNLPVTLNHSDVHLKNWYVLPGDEMGLGDWQVVVGSGFRDVAYALSTALSIEDRRSWERDLLRFYLETLDEHCGAKIDFDDAWLYYRQQLFSALAFWTATLTPSEDLPAMQPQATSLKFIERMTHAIDDLDALDSLDVRGA